MRPTSLAVLAVLAFLTGAAPAAAAPQSWDLAADWGGPAWSMRQSSVLTPDDATGLLPRNPLTYTTAGMSRADELESKPIENYAGSEPEPFENVPFRGYPTVAYNQGGDTSLQSGQMLLPASGVLVHPGDDRLAVIRWTSPVTARIFITARFADINSGGGGFDWSVDRGTENLGAGAPPGEFPVGGLRREIDVVAGEHLYFTVGDGGDGRTYDATSARIRIETVEAPSGNLVTNGSFELPVVSGGTFATVWTDLLPGWTVDEQVDVLSPLWNASEGMQSLDLNGTPGVGAVTQTVPTAAGEEYELSYDVGVNADALCAGDPPTRRLKVFWEGAQLGPEIVVDTAGRTPENMKWVHRTATVTASTAGSTLRLQSTSPETPSCGATVDNVSVREALSGSILVSPAGPLKFPNTEAGKVSPVETLTVTNDTGETMTIDKVMVTGPFNSGDAGNCTKTLPHRASCSFSIAFTPAVNGPATGELSFRSPTGGLIGPVAGLAGIGLNAGAGADPGAPQVVVRSPAAQPSVIQGQAGPTVDFECLETRPGDSGVARCKAYDGDREVSNGEVLDTSAVGERIFEVNTRDHAGTSDTVQVRWRVTPRPDPVISAGSVKYSVLSVHDVVHPPVPYVLPDGRVVVSCSFTSPTVEECAIASECQDLDGQIGPALPCQNFAHEVQRKNVVGTLDPTVNVMSGVIGNLNNFQPPKNLLDSSYFALHDELGNVVASGGGNVIASGGGNVIASGGGNLTISGAKIHVPKAPGVKILERKAGDVIDSAGNVIASGGGNVIASGGGNVIASGGGNFTFTGPGWQIVGPGGKVIASGGGNVIASGGGNVIASGGGNVIASGGGNVIASGGGNVIASGGGNVIASGGGNAIVLARGSLANISKSAVPQQTINFLNLAAGGALYTSKVEAFSGAAGALASTSAKKEKPKRIVIAKASLEVNRPGFYRVVTVFTKDGKKLLKRLRKARKSSRLKLTVTNQLTRAGHQPVGASKAFTVRTQRTKRR